MSQIERIFKKLSQVPGGKAICSRVLTFNVPYFTSIRPKIITMDNGLCEVEMKDRRAVRNHLGTVHAIAMCNLCELAMGLAAESAIPPDLRWIPKGMQVQYLKKARGTLRGTSRIDPGAMAPGDFNVPIEVKDKDGNAVMRANITLYITKRPDAPR